MNGGRAIALVHRPGRELQQLAPARVVALVAFGLGLTALFASAGWFLHAILL